MVGDALPVQQRGSRQQLPEEVASYVRELIISGAVRPGEYLRMERIAEAVGVSNTPVREGLLALRSEGFVRLVPRRGFVVAPFTPQDVRDLFWAQAQLASELAARAAKKMTPEIMARDLAFLPSRPAQQRIEANDYFAREADTLAQLKHPAIPAISDRFDDQNVHTSQLTKAATKATSTTRPRPPVAGATCELRMLQVTAARPASRINEASLPLAVPISMDWKLGGWPELRPR